RASERAAGPGPRAVVRGGAAGVRDRPRAAGTTGFVIAALPGTWSLSSLSGTSFHHSHFPPELLSARRDCTISVCIPARDEAATIAPIVESLVRLGEQGVVDQVVVVDASKDGTGEIAARL